MYVQPTRYEGKAVTVTEERKLGKPILITNYPTASSQIEDGIERFYKGSELRYEVINYNNDKDYCDSNELEKLYGCIP